MDHPDKRTESSRAAFWKYLRSGDGRDSMLGEERRDLGYGTDGSVLPPKEFAKEVVAKLQQFALFDLVHIERGVPGSLSTPYEVNGLTAAFRSRQASGGTDFVTTTTTTPSIALPNFGTIASEDRRPLQPSIVSASVFVSNELLDDAAQGGERGASAERYISEAFARKITGVASTKFMVGSGTGEPKGIRETCRYGVTGSLDNGIVAAGGANIANADLGKLIRGVGSAYYPRCTWMLAPETFADIPGRTGIQITQGVTENGIACPTMLGRPVVLVDDLDAPAAGSKYSMGLADLSRYVVTIGGPGEMTFMRSRENALTGASNASLLIGFMRIDGVLVDPSAARVLRHT